MLDDDEKGIVRLLQEDGRMSTVELARRLQVSEPTARKKLNRILNDGIVKVRAVASPVDLGYTTPVYIGLVVERAKLNEVAEAVARYDFVESVTISTGPYDVTIKAGFVSASDVYKFLFEELIKHDGIRDSDTTFIFRDIKQHGLVGVVGVDSPPSAEA
ncbi:Lrp/AsnC family transcriptional regulator for asnA, asnC and gidA [Mycoplana sp. BE70]|uniref:Lrp/AsnC family transcriptional regulator n=1 Tax=Mycoplana sp. BE70 TaxID=2817775 RepID=UPI00285A3581|nr:Lrp/AsnC family transcriptional regulator [Mycoplana sp. BE70]MDR6759170.1 Lrp/AsnC family transcriptional regulator for asnA, asnC and gidA [Mycoplana sp. BE70]